MTEGGGIINGREYSQHAMERMAPDTPSVRAELSRRAEALAESKGLQVGTPEYYQFCQKYVDPRNIPPSVIEDAIRNTTAVPGHTAGTFVYQTADVTVIVNDTGKVITVIPKQEDRIVFIKFDNLDMLEFFENEPISIGEEGEAKFIYSMKDSFQLSMTLTVDTYAKKIDISVRYSDNTVFAGEFDNVLEIKKAKMFY